VERVAGILAVEDDLAAIEAPAPRDGEEQPHLLLGNVAQEAPFHELSLCDDGHSPCVRSGNDTAKPRF
jgi:hypothetical protein